MANPYYVQALSGRDPGLMLQDYIDREKQEEQQALDLQKQEEMQGLLGRAYDGEADAIREIFTLDPDAGLKLKEIEDERIAKLGNERKRIADDANFEYSRAIKSAQTPEEKQAIIDRAIEDPTSDLYDESDIGKPLRDIEFDANLNLYTKLGDKGYSALLGNQSSKTAKQKDFETYQRLKEEDPEAAKTFGSGAGFISDDKKRIFKIEGGIKYFSDGTEQPVGPKDKLKTEDMRTAMSQEQAMKIVDKAKEGQLKNAGFALTLNDGLSTVNKMVSEGYDPTSAGWINKYLAGTTIGNLAMSEQDQTFVGSVEQMINAIARRETGAAITEFEKKDFFNRYMPVAGDKPARIKQKKAALERQFKSIRGQAGSVYDAIRVTQGFDKKEQQAEPEIQRTDEEILAEYGL